MTCTIVGVVADRDGLARQLYLEPGRDHPEVRHAAFAIPAGNYGRRQPGSIPLRAGHDEIIGDVVHLERNAAGSLLAVATAVDELAAIPGPIRFSPEIECRPGPGADFTDIEMTGLAVTYSPASAGLPEITVLPGDLRDVDARGAWTARQVRHLDVLRRAADTRRRHQPGDPLLIRDHTPDPRYTMAVRHDGMLWVDTEPVGPADTTSAPSTAFVDLPRNVIADETGRTYLAAIPGRPGPRPLLMFNGTPVARHAPDLDRPGLIAFRALNGERADEALVLCADAIVDHARPRVRLDGTWRTAELVAG